MESNGTTEREGNRRQRSPQHPAFSLPEAIEKARVLFNKEGAAMVSAVVALEHWGYSAKSSSGLRCLATMSDFGLVDVQGTGGSKRIGISQLGRLLARHPDQDSEEYQKALRTAALSPKSHELIHKNYDRLPSDQSLSWDLESVWGFLPSSIPAFIAELRQTFDLAKPWEADNLPEKQENAAEPETSSRSMARVQPANAGAGMKQEVFTLNEGDVVLQWPSRLSQASYEDFKDWLELILRKASRAISDDSTGDPEDPESA